MDPKHYFKKHNQAIEKALDQYLPAEKEPPSVLHKAMRYAVFSGGKRIRPILLLEACRVVGGSEKQVLAAACAVELIHNYSLVHDDLPCMDDDHTRRGRPTCHKKFGEVTALLAGDALLTLAFQILNQTNGRHTLTELKRKFQSASWIASAIGTRGMVGGQAVDIEYQGKEPNLAIMEYINVHKSGSLIAACIRVGAYLGGGSPRQIEALYQYGKSLGLLFQIVDDILDKEGYARIIGLSQTQEEAQRMHRRAIDSLKIFGSRGRVLSQMADFVLTRKY